MGKYAPLTDWLDRCAKDTVTLSIAEMEEILGFKLPPSASKYTAWWSNDIIHTQTFGWRDAGFQIADTFAPIRTGSVTFTRQNKRGKLQTKPKTAVVDSREPERQIVTKNMEFSQTYRGGSWVFGKYVFRLTPFTIMQRNISGTFLLYGGKSVRELLNNHHYNRLSSVVEIKYRQYLDRSIKDFMQDLVKAGDPFYLKFLNRHGADKFCRFGLTDKSVYKLRGLYLYEYEGKVVYVGRCRDNFYTRFNINYGQIQPINCYKGGQSTNTHLNSRMNLLGDKISIYICPLKDLDEIIQAEAELILRIQPEWNRAGVHKYSPY